MREDARQRATEFVKELYASGEIDADQLDTGVAGALAAQAEAEVAEVVRSLPAPVALTIQRAIVDHLKAGRHWYWRRGRIPI